MSLRPWSTRVALLAACAGLAGLLLLDNAAAAPLCRPHGAYQVFGGAAEVAIPSYGLDLVGYVVASEEGGENAARTQRVGLEGNKQ